MPMMPRCQPSPAMTSIFVGRELGVGGEAASIFAQHFGFGFAALGLRRSSFSASSVGAGGVAGGEELDDFGGDVHAAGGVDARSRGGSRGRSW
jgi:hypothetical protein